MIPHTGLIIYHLVMGVIAIILTVYDKWASQHRPRHRIPEMTLLLVAVLGGSIAMYSTMKLIRHKTQKAKFMWGLPLIILGKLAIFYFFITRLTIIY